jgi:hypothetical protein
VPDGSSGFPGWFIALFVIFGVIILTGFIVAIARSIWQFSVLRSGGLNPLVAKEQLEARLNQRLTTPPAPPLRPESRSNSGWPSCRICTFAA